MPLAMNEGWAAPKEGRQMHYFRRGKSLCGRAKYFGPPMLLKERGTINEALACARCRISVSTEGLK